MRVHRFELYLIHEGRPLRVARWEFVPGKPAKKFRESITRACLELGGHRRLFDHELEVAELNRGD